MSMRITNQMVTNNSLRNMQKSMSDVNTRTQQMTSGKKISKASEDPVTAIRALKLRTTVNQLEQYKDKNILDARSWFSVTQTSLDNITRRIKDISEYCVQGATDSFSTDDRSSIIDSLIQMKNMINDEGNATYAGRYIFSGYKTDRSLAFSDTDDTTKYSYDIKQSFTSDDIDMRQVVINEVDSTKIDGYIADPTSYTQPAPKDVYRINLGYQNIDNINSEGTNVLSLKATKADGTAIDLSGFAITVKDTDDAATYYDVADDGINIIKETGEIIFGVDVYNTIKQADSIDVEYAKNEFEAGELRPEHYYDCTQREIQSDGSIRTVDYVFKKEGQPIYYEVNFNQSIQVNTEGNKLINSKISNYIDDLIYTLRDLDEAEQTQKNLEKMLKDSQYANDDEAVARINQLLRDVDAEVAIKKETMQKTFSNNITNFQDYMDLITATQSDLGSRMSKLEMIEVRVTEQYAEFKELKSKNEDVETDEALINFKEANLVYESALAATGNIMRKSLLDYI